MPMYKNVASKKIVIAGPSGALVEIVPGQAVDLPDHIARKGFPYLQLESVQVPQILTEAPAPLEQVTEKVEEPVTKKKSTKKKKGA